MKFKFNNKGLTLIELILVMAILGIAITLTFGLLLYGRNVFDKGYAQQEIQYENRYFADFIEGELNPAFKVDILEELPEEFQNNRRYIYIENDNLMHKIPHEVPQKIIALSSDVDSELYFKKVTNTIVSYEIISSSREQEYSVSTEVDILNMKGESVNDRIVGDEGKVISYAYSSTSNNLITFGFEKSFNGGLDLDYFSPPVKGEVVVYLPNGTDLTKLTPSFRHTGIEVEINSIVQVSNEKQGDFSSNTRLTVKAEDGGIKEYTIIVRIRPDAPPAVDNLRIYPKDPDPNKDENQWEITPTAWHTSHIFSSYNYISNGNGENRSTLKWLVGNSENGSFTEISGQVSYKLIAEEKYIDKWVKYEITPIGESGNVGVPVISKPIKIEKDSNNPLWKRIVEDLHYIYLGKNDEEAKKEFDKIREDNGLEPYEVIVKIRDDILKHLDVTTNVAEQKLIIDGKASILTTIGSNYGSLLTIDLDRYKSIYNIDLDGYRVLVDAKIIKGNGWGILLNGTVNEENKDTGYMFQFDPGAGNEGSFLLRRFFNGNHNPFDGLGVNKYYNYINIINENFKYNDSNGWSPSGKNGYYSEYTTELVLQKQLDNSMILRTKIWKDENNKSNEIWFGDFGEVTLPNSVTNLNNTTKFQGVASDNSKPSNANNPQSKSFVELASGWGTMLGLRTWTTSGDFSVEFSNITLDKGLEMNLVSAKYMVDNLGTINEKSNKLLLTFDQELRKNDFRIRNLILNNELGSISSINLSPLDKKSIIVILNKTITDLKTIYNNRIERGSVRHINAGDVNISNGNDFKVDGSVDSFQIYNIKNVNQSNRYINVNNSSLNLSNSNSNDNQKWIITKATNGSNSYNIININGKSLEMLKNGNNYSITLSDYESNSLTQQWNLIDAGNGYYYIDSVNYPGRRINASNSSSTNVVNNSTSNSAKWQLIKID